MILFAFRPGRHCARACPGQGSAAGRPRSGYLDAGSSSAGDNCSEGKHSTPRPFITRLPDFNLDDKE